MKKLSRQAKSGAAIAVAAVTGVSLAGLAFASSLSMTSPMRPSFLDVARCSPEGARVDIDNGLATVTVPQGCSEEQVELFLAGHDGVERVQVGTGSNTVSVPSAAALPEEVLVTAGTWPLPTDWSAKEDPVEPEVGDSPFTCTVPEGECTAELTYKAEWGTAPWVYEVRGEMTSTSATPQTWTMTINLSSLEFPFLANDLRDDGGGLLQRVDDSGCDANPRTVTVKGRVGWAGDQVSQGAVVHFSVRGFDTIQAYDAQRTLMQCP